jgi:hypothetical protein
MYLDRILECHFPFPDNNACHGSQYELYVSMDVTDVDAVVVLAGVGLFAFVWWWAGARHYCIFLLDVTNADIGPRTNTQIIVGEEIEQERTE